MYLSILFLFCLTAHAEIGIENHTLVLDSYVFEKQNKLLLAIERMNKVAISESDNYFVQMRLGHLFVARKDLIKATAHYVKATEIRAKSIEPWLELAQVFSKSNEEVKTKNFAKEVLKRAPYHRGAGLLFVKAAEKLKSHSDGLEVTNEFLVAYPNDAYFLEKKAFFLSNLARKDEAKQTLAELLLVSPDNEYARKFMGKEP